MRPAVLSQEHPWIWLLFFATVMDAGCSCQLVKVLVAVLAGIGSVQLGLKTKRDHFLKPQSNFEAQTRIGHACTGEGLGQSKSTKRTVPNRVSWSHWVTCSIFLRQKSNPHSYILGFHGCACWRCWVQCDNTVKELNQYGSRAFSTLVQGGIFGACTEAHLRVGHTHEDVDSLFALLTAGMRATPACDLQTPRDLQKMIQTKLSGMFLDKDQGFGVEIIDTVPWFLLKSNQSFGLPSTVLSPKTFWIAKTVNKSLHVWQRFYQTVSAQHLSAFVLRSGIRPLFCLTKFLSKTLSGSARSTTGMIAQTEDHCLKCSLSWPEMSCLIKGMDCSCLRGCLGPWDLQTMGTLQMISFALSKSQWQAGACHKIHC